MRRIRPQLTYANVMSTIAVFGVLAGGSAWAASKIDTNQIKKGAVTARKLHNDSVTTNKIRDDAVTGDKAKESSFGQVPDAAHADDATNLDGKPASDYRLHCPGNLDRAGDVCHEVDTRPSAKYHEALKACALDQRRLPTASELALAYDNLSARTTSGPWATSPMAAEHWPPCSDRTRLASFFRRPTRQMSTRPSDA